jgi:hypothetical protein
MIFRFVVGTFAVLLGTISLLFLREGLSEPHSPGGYILLVTTGATGLIVALTPLLGLLLTGRSGLKRP